jgi:APA family basic amino acid/polyamine antiporter
MARKLPGLRRELGAGSLFSVAYGEIASSIYFALGIISLHAVGFTPFVLLGVGVLFLIVALSYAEATSALPETGGAATFVRRASNDLFGFLTGWVLFLDYLIVIALSALFVPHYLAGAFQVGALEKNPWDDVVGVAVIVIVGVIRLVRRPSLYALSTIIPALDVVTQLILIVFGLALLVSPGSVTKGTDLGTAPTVHSLLFAIPLAMLAFTGLETVANLAEEAKRPGVDLPRSLFLAIATVITAYVAIAIVGLSAFPGPKTELGTVWLRSPLVGIAEAIRAHTANGVGDVIRFFVGASGALILVVSVTTSMSGFSRLAYSLGEHGQLPRVFGRLHRRTLVSPQAIVSVTVISSAIVIASGFMTHDVAFLASVFSFGVLLAFTATQLAVIKLRVAEPDLPRPYRTPLNVTIRGSEIPLPAIVGSILTIAAWFLSIATHPGARYAGPIWLLIGIVIFIAVRMSHGEGLTERVIAPDTVRFDDVPHFRRILVPMKLGVIGEEMAATAIKLAHEHRAAVEALYVVAVPLELPIGAELPDAEARAEASLAEARTLGEELGVEVGTLTLRSRSIGRAIVDRAREINADLIVLGSSPRWRRQSRFFSPTVDFVLRQAPCEVIIVAFPQNVIDEEVQVT